MNRARTRRCLHAIGQASILEKDKCETEIARNGVQHKRNSPRLQGLVFSEKLLRRFVWHRYFHASLACCQNPKCGIFPMRFRSFQPPPFSDKLPSPYFPMLDKLVSALSSSSLISSAVTPILQQQLGQAGIVRSVQIDPAKKSAEIIIDLAGETNPLILSANGYSLGQDNGKAILEIASWSCPSHAWIEILGHKFLPDAKIPLPVPYALASSFL